MPELNRILTFYLLNFIVCHVTMAQQPVIIGMVRDAQTKEALPGVNISTESFIGTVSDSAGKYRLQLSAGKYRITFRFVGYASETKNAALSESDALIMNVDMIPESRELRTVVVSAGKFEQRIEEVTVSMDVIKPQLIENTNASTMESAMEQVPGVTVIDGQANIRGGSGFSYGAGSRVLLLVDDLPMMAADANDVKWTFLPVENISQVEVLKGASSALFGSSAMNGVINIRTAYPKDKPETRFSTFYGIYDSPSNKAYKWWGSISPEQYGMSFFHSRKISRLDFVLGANSFTDNSYRQLEYEARNRMNMNLRYRVLPEKNLYAGLSINLMQTDGRLFFLWQDDSTGALIPMNGTLSGYTTLRASFDPYVTFLSENGGSHKLRTRYFRTENHNNTSQESFAGLYYGEYQFQKKFFNMLTWTAGVADIYSDIKSELYGNHTANNIAGFMQSDLTWRRWNFSAGGRTEQNRTDTVNSGFITVARAGLNYRLLSHTHLRASFGQGYRFPSIAEKFIRTQVGLIVVYPNDSLEPESGYTAEIGLNQGFKISRWKGLFDISVFQSDYNDMMEFRFGQWGKIFVDPLFGAGFKSVNVGNTRIQGLELTLNGEGMFGNILVRTLSGITIIYPISKDFDAKIDTLRNSANYNILKYRYRRLFKSDIELEFRNILFGTSIRYNSFMENVDAYFEDEFAVPGVKHYRQTHPNGDWIFDVRFFVKFLKYFDAGIIIKNLANHEYVNRPADMQPPRTFILQGRTRF